MAIGSEQYFSESTNGLAIQVGTSSTVLHTFPNNNTYEIFLYASSESNQTVTVVNGGTSIALDTTAFSDNALFYGQLISGTSQITVTSTGQTFIRGYLKEHTE